MSLTFMTLLHDDRWTPVSFVPETCMCESGSYHFHDFDRSWQLGCQFKGEETIIHFNNI